MQALVYYSRWPELAGSCLESLLLEAWLESFLVISEPQSLLGSPNRVLQTYVRSEFLLWAWSSGKEVCGNEWNCYWWGSKRGRTFQLEKYIWMLRIFEKPISRTLIGPNTQAALRYRTPENHKEHLRCDVIGYLNGVFTHRLLKGFLTEITFIFLLNEVPWFSGHRLMGWEILWWICFDDHGISWCLFPRISFCDNEQRSDFFEPGFSLL